MLLLECQLLLISNFCFSCSYKCSSFLMASFRVWDSNNSISSLNAIGNPLANHWILAFSSLIHGTYLNSSMNLMIYSSIVNWPILSSYNFFPYYHNNVKTSISLKELLKIILGQFFLNNGFKILQVLPPYFFFSLEVISGDSSFHILRIVLNSKKFLHSQQPSFYILLFIHIPIKCGWLNLPKFFRHMTLLFSF